MLTNKKTNEITKKLYKSLKKVNKTKKQKQNLLKKLIEQYHLLVKKKKTVYAC